MYDALYKSGNFVTVACTGLKSAEGGPDLSTSFIMHQSRVLSTLLGDIQYTTESAGFDATTLKVGDSISREMIAVVFSSKDDTTVKFYIYKINDEDGEKVTQIFTYTGNYGSGGNVVVFVASSSSEKL